MKYSQGDLSTSKCSVFLAILWQFSGKSLAKLWQRSSKFPVAFQPVL
ncbi:unnamed protein product, partial [marine sediment metagenome]